LPPTGRLAVQDDKRERRIAKRGEKEVTESGPDREFIVSISLIAPLSFGAATLRDASLE